MNGIGHFRSIERFYHWLGAYADAARCEEETRLRRIAELPELDGTDDDG